jgi:hypothetical protein
MWLPSQNGLAPDAQRAMLGVRLGKTCGVQRAVVTKGIIVTPVAERLVRGQTTAAERHSGVAEERLAVSIQQFDVTLKNEWSVWGNRYLVREGRRLRIHSTALHMKCSGWALRYDLFDGIG